MAPLLKLLTLVDSLLCFFLPRLWCWTESTRYHWPKEDDRILTLNFDSWFSGEGKEQCHCQLMTCNDYCGNRKLKQRRQRRQRERQKTNRFRLVKQQLCTCITLFCTFLCRRCTTTTWKCLISHSDVLSRTGKQNNNFLFLFPNNEDTFRI